MRRGSPSNQTPVVTCLLPEQEKRGLGEPTRTMKGRVRFWGWGPFMFCCLITEALCEGPESNLSAQKSVRGQGSGGQDPSQTSLS